MKFETREQQIARIARADHPVTWSELEQEFELAEQRGRAEALASQYLTIKEAARVLKVCRESIYNYINAGKLPFIVSVSGRRLIRVSDLMGLPDSNHQ